MNDIPVEDIVSTIQSVFVIDEEYLYKIDIKNLWLWYDLSLGLQEDIKRMKKEIEEE